MDKLLEFVAPILPNVFALLCPNLEEKMETLRRKMRFLKRRRDDIDVELRSHSGKRRKTEVENWMDDVKSLMEEFGTLEQRVQQSSRFYHVFKRKKLAEQLKRNTEEVTELDNHGEFHRGLFHEVDESSDRLLPIPQPNGQALQQNLDDTCNLDDIWTSLMDDNVIRIGIYGVGGVGKTTLARHAHDKLKESTRSGHVYWVTVSQEFSTVSQEFNIYRLQSDIAQALKLNFSCGSDEKKRAAQLFREFEKRGRFVLILDDVWKQINARKVGIPLKSYGCKLVVTSRSEEVFQGTYWQKIIKVNTLSEQKALDLFLKTLVTSRSEKVCQGMYCQTLSEQEALDLFLKTLDCDELSVEVKEICKKMVKRCGGLPLALITLAGSMRGVTDTNGWIDALGGLEYSFLGRLDEQDEVLPILLYSYHRLRDPRLKSCFLYCSLYPKDSPISRNQLIENFISEELLERRLSMQAELAHGHAILNQLVRACLLESDSDGYLKMHDLMREMAIGITKDNPRYMVKAGLHLEELPEEQEWTEDLDKVSLMCNSIEEISLGTSPKCPSLSTLILSKNPLRSIPDYFFMHMCGLRTLDLSGTKIRRLPSLKKLKELRHLDLTNTPIEEVPQGMESLTNLKRLSLSCYELKMIPTGILHRLAHLQQLELPYHLRVPVEEVEALKQLEVFQGRLNSVRDLNRLINSRQDKQFLFYNITLSSRQTCQYLKFGLPCKNVFFGEDSLMESSDTVEDMLPRDIVSLSFLGSGLSGCLLDEFPILNSTRDLKECSIDKEDKIECIMRLEDEQQSSTGVPFQSLEFLLLSDLPNIIGLFKWEAVAPLRFGTFSCLKHLTIECCGKIKKLFPQSLARNFCNLRKLKVKQCEQMEEIIEDDNNEGADIKLLMLKELTLENLPQLKSICKGKMKCDSIEFIYLKCIENVKGLPFNLPLFDGQLSPPTCLKSIEIHADDEKWWESLEWAHHNAKNVLDPLVTFI